MDQSDLIEARGQALADGELDIGFDETSHPQVAPVTPSPLFDLGQLDVRWDEDRQTLWTYMTPDERPSFTLAMLRDFDVWQSEITRIYGPEENKLKYLVLGSRFPGVWNFGGDLGLFARYIRDKDKQSLVDYGQRCVNILYKNMYCLDLPMVTIGLVQGQALGGGFEALLSFNVLIAERSAKFGLPEVAFGLFPGMGAHALLIRRLGLAKAEQMILSGQTYTADEMHELGIVHQVIDDGKGEAAVEEYIRLNNRRHAGNSAAYRASAEVLPVTFEELNSIVDIWAETALKLQEKDLRLMERLVSAQSKLSRRISAN